MNKGILVFVSIFLVYDVFAQKVRKEETDDEGGKPPAVMPMLIRGPYLQCASPGSMMIRWRTDVSARTRVRFGGSPDGLTGMADDSSLVTEHRVLLSGLEPGTRYYYSIGGFRDTLSAGADDYFYTLPVSGSAATVRVGVFGDCGNNSVNQRAVRDQVLKYLDTAYLNAWILLGDNAYTDGTDAEFQSNFFNVYKDKMLKQYPLFPAPGNHDYHDREFSASVAQKTHGVAYYQDFSVPENGEAGGVPSHTAAFYSYDIGNAHFLSLDSYGKEAKEYRLYDTLGPQVQWIKKDLEAYRNRWKGWVIAYWHHPPFTMGSHNSDHEAELVHIRENFIRILERYGVDLVLCGHSHDYERSRLMRGYYGDEASFDPSKYDLSFSSGRDDGSPGSSPYVKESGGAGTVYVVSGSAGKLGGQQATFPHNAMYFSDAEHGGASMLEITGDRLEFKWICADGVVRDRFTMMRRPGQDRK
jgi:hypothetical protein